MGDTFNIERNDKRRVVIVGGGFAGVALLRKLRNKNLQVVLIDRNNFHAFQPLLYQVATSGLEPTAISFPLRRILRGWSDFHFRMATVESVDCEHNRIQTSVGGIDYDFLVLAFGASTAYYGMSDIECNSMPLKSVAEALALRNSIYKRLEKTIRQTDPVQRHKELTFVIVGGGPTGVESAGAIAELRNKILPKDYPQIDFKQMRVVLLNAGDRILESFSEQSSKRARHDLEKLGVEVICQAKVSGYQNNSVIYNESSAIESKNVIWTSGVTANKIKGIGLCGRGGRIRVNESLNVIEHAELNEVVVHPNVFAVGDVAIVECAAYGGGHPQVAQAAIQQGRTCAINIIRSIRKESPLAFAYKDKGSMATIGRNKAVVEIGRFKLYGFWAWLAWLIVHMLSILGVKNKLTALWDWSWSYITREQPLRSIIESNRSKCEE